MRQQFSLLLIGICLMLIPGKKQQKQASSLTTSVTKSDSPNISQQLELFLQQIEGAGKVKVLLTISKGEETVYQNDIKTSDSDNSFTSDIKTVILTDGNKNEYGLITNIIGPVYQGAVIACQGADRPEVRLAITEAVSKLTGLRSDHIYVMKLK